MTFSALLISSMQVERRVDTQDAIGGTVERWETVTSAAPCRIRMLSASERVINGGYATDCTHRLYCDPQDLAEGDRITIDGVHYAVESINRHGREATGGTYPGTFYEVDCYERRPERG